MNSLDTVYQKRITKLFKDCRIKHFAKNQLIQYKDDPLTNIYLIKEGYVKAYSILDSGDTRTLFILGPGDIFPIVFSVSLDWDKYRLKYFYQALTDVDVHVNPQDNFKETIEKDDTMKNTYMAYMGATNEAIMNQLEIMKHKKAINKILQLLPYLISKFGRKIKPNVYQLGVKLSHQEMADLSGVTRETTSILIKQLEKEGTIKQKKGKWVIRTKKKKP